MESLATSAETNALVEWLQRKSTSGAPPTRDESSPSPTKPIGSGDPLTGHLEELLPDLPQAGATAEQQIAKEKAHEIKSLSSRHREIMRRVLEGANYFTIAEEMNLSHTTISIVANSRLFKEELLKMEAARDDRIIQRADVLAGEALDTLKNQMRAARSESIRNRAANDILDRAGYSKIEKKLVGIVNAEDVIKELNKERRVERTVNE